MTVMDVYKYQPDLLRIARWHSPDDPDSASDAVQTLYLKLCEMEAKEGNLDRIFYNGNLNMVYIFSSIKNILINQYRATKNIDRFPEDYDCPDRDEEDAISNDEMCCRVREELSKMREYDRLMALTYYTEEHSIRSLASNVGISPKNVFVTLSRVRSKIKSVILENPDKFPKL
jgi:RNA polymerase sigma factor (sigma-70 family)